MKHLRHPFLILSLVASLLIVGGVFANQSTAHSLHHDHHKTATHASMICTWMCAAGQVVDVADPILDSPIHIVGTAEAIPYFSVHPVFSLVVFDRGPPLSLL